MRLGIFGVGRIGTFHAAVLASLPEVEGLVIFDPSRTRAGAVAGDLGAEVAGSPEALLGHVDGAVIATPTAQHAELIHRCLDAGVPTMCEKPVALQLADLRAVVRHSTEVGGVLQIGFQRRFDAGYCEAQRLVRDGDMGRVYSFRAATHDPAPPHLDYIRSSGGIFRDLHIHDFDVIRFVLGREVQEVYATGSVLAFPDFADADDFDTATVAIRLEDETLGVVTGARHDPLGYDVRLEVFGARDSVSVGLDERTPIRSLEPGSRPLGGPPYPDFQRRFEAAYRAELASFVEVVAGRAQPRCTAQDAYEALRIAVAADRSARDGGPVSVGDVT